MPRLREGNGKSDGKLGSKSVIKREMPKVEVLTPDSIEKTVFDLDMRYGQLKEEAEQQRILDDARWWSIGEEEFQQRLKMLSKANPPGVLDEQGVLPPYDFIRDKLQSVIVVLGAVSEDRPVFVAAVTPDLVEKGYNAGGIVKQVSRVAGGGGGGKASFAQAGGKHKDKLDEALDLVKDLI